MADTNKIQFISPTQGFYIHLRFDNHLAASIAVIVVFALIILTSVASFYITRYFTLRFVERLCRRGDYKWLSAALHHRVFHTFALLAPGAIFYLSSSLISGISFRAISMLGKPLEVLSAIYMIIVGAIGIFGFLNSIEDRYNHFPFSRQRPIKSYLQIIKIFLCSLVALIIISLVLDRSPAYFLTGLGAMAAVLMLVFRDSLLGFVASIQLAAYDMVRLEDWIEVPNFGAKGKVIDISLNTIKVQNFDNAIVMVPSYAMLTNGVKNWRGMSEAGSRLIKRAVMIDPHTVIFCPQDLPERLKNLPLLHKWAIHHPLKDSKTNLGLFREYLIHYLAHFPDIQQEKTCLVRILDAEGKGIPLEINAFTAHIADDVYEHTQAAIFEHIYAALPLFDLKVFSKA